MKSTIHSPLLSDPPEGRHIAQFHRTSESLTDSVAHYLAEGLRRDEPVVAILEEKNAAPILKQVKSLGADPGRAIIRDAGAALERFMIGDLPDRQRFRGMFEEISTTASRSGTKPMRLYGEMVNTLWSTGRPQAAIRLEIMWNEVIAEGSFRLFCCYMVDTHDPAVYRNPIHQIGHVHTDILPTADDDRLIAALDTASKEAFGFPLDRLMEREKSEIVEGERKLPGSQRAMMWIIRHVPGSIGKLINRAREILEAPPPKHGKK